MGERTVAIPKFRRTQMERKDRKVKKTKSTYNLQLKKNKDIDDTSWR